MTTLVWRRSSFTHDYECIEVAWPNHGVALRDSKHRAGARLHFPRDRFADFLARLVTRA